MSERKDLIPLLEINRSYFECVDQGLEERFPIVGIQDPCLVLGRSVRYITEPQNDKLRGISDSIREASEIVNEISREYPSLHRGIGYVEQDQYLGGRISKLSQIMGELREDLPELINELSVDLEISRVSQVESYLRYIYRTVF